MKVLCALFCGASVAAASSSSGLAITVSKQNFSISVSVGGKPWMDSSIAKLHTEAGWASTADGTLATDTPLISMPGKDRLGMFTRHAMSWTTRDGTPFETAVRDYTAGGIPALVFEQRFAHGANNTALAPAKESKDSVLSTFPSLLPRPRALGAVEYYDQMVGGMAEGTSIKEWSTGGSGVIRGGTMGGPVVLFDQPASPGSSPNAMVLGYFSNFLTGSCVQDQRNGALDFGLLGSITSIPANYSSSMMLYFSADGVNAAVEGYGAALLKYYGKPGRQWETAADDVSIQSLGYYTDNGAFYCTLAAPHNAMHMH